MRRYQCPACNNKNVVDKGPLSPLHEGLFGGKPAPIKLEAGQFLWCPECDLHFRYPYIDQHTLTSLYQRLPATIWRHDKPLPVWYEVEKLLKAYSANNTILEVGCFCGDFLAFLSGGWQKLGVEPNTAAAEIARARGIELVGDAIEHIQTTVKPAGAILLLDTLEHICQPLVGLRRLQRLLAPGGSIIIFTGATNTLPWRVFGRYYWYSALPEHVIFFSLRWFRWAASELGMQLAWHRYLPFKQGRIIQWLVQFANLFLYTVVQRLGELGILERISSFFPLVKKVARWKFAPMWYTAKDHILVVLSL